MKIRSTTTTTEPTIAVHDQLARAAEKVASRDADGRALASGARTREDLTRENSLFAFTDARIDLASAVKLYPQQPRRRSRRSRTKVARAEQANRYERTFSFFAVADGQPIRRPGAARQNNNTRVPRRRAQEKR